MTSNTESFPVPYHEKLIILSNFSTMWFIYTITSSLFFTGSRTIDRYLLKGKKDSWAYSFWYSVIGALTNLPFFVFHPSTPDTALPWLLLLLASLLIVAHNYLSFMASNYLSPSFKGAISKTRLLWILLFGILILDESFNLQKLAGTAVILLASLIVLNGFNKKEQIKGMIVLVISTFLYGILITMYTGYFTEHFNSASYSFLIFLFPAIMNFILMPNSTQRTKIMIKAFPTLIVIGGVLAGFGNLLMAEALRLGEQSDVIIIMEALAVMIIGTEFFILKEKDKPMIKIAAITLAVIGTILIKIN